jgi:hypothetical protein
MKFVISIEKLVGLEKFTNEDYATLRFEHFKPLFVVFVIQLFYEHKLQDNYPIVDRLIDLLIKCEQYVPFGDLHHLVQSIKIIKNPKYIECVQRIKDRVNFVQTMNVDSKNSKAKDWKKIYR